MCKISWYKSRFQRLSGLLGPSCDLAGKTYSCAWFRTVSIYVCINCLNNSLVNNGTRVGLEFRFKKLGVAKPDILEASLPCAIAPLGAKSLFSLLVIAEPRREFVWQVLILKQSKKALSLFKQAGYTFGYRAFRIIIEKST